MDFVLKDEYELSNCGSKYASASTLMVHIKAHCTLLSFFLFLCAQVKNNSFNIFVLKSWHLNVTTKIEILKTSTRCEAVFKLNFNCVYIYCATFVGFDFCAVNWSQLPRPGRGSCPVSLPAGRGQSGAQIEAGHSRPAPAPSATATPHWRTLSGLEGAWINTDTRTTMRILITSKHRHGQTFTFQHIQTNADSCVYLNVKHTNCVCKAEKSASGACWCDNTRITKHSQTECIPTDSQSYPWVHTHSALPHYVNLWPQLPLILMRPHRGRERLSSPSLGGNTEPMFRRRTD